MTTENSKATDVHQAMSNSDRTSVEAGVSAPGAYTPGPWLLATSNSWRRFLARDGGSVCEPITQRDGHPDLYFRNGGAEGPDARLIAAAPELLEALIEVKQILDMVLGVQGGYPPGANGPAKKALNAIRKAIGSGA